MKAVNKSANEKSKVSSHISQKATTTVQTKEVNTKQHANLCTVCNNVL